MTLWFFVVTSSQVSFTLCQGGNMNDSNQSVQSTEMQKRTKLLGWWTGGWVLTMAITNFGPKFIWDYNEVFSIISILVNLAIGAGMIIANRDHIRCMDEMQQKIQLEAMALSLGSGLIIGMAYSNLDVTNVIPADAEISHLAMIMVAAYAVGIYKGTRKYG